MSLTLLIEDPLWFLLLYFLWGTPMKGPSLLFLLALITSIITYPLTYLCRGVYRYLGENKEEWEGWKKELSSCIIGSFILWVAIRLWYVAMGSYFITDIFGFITWILVSGVIGYLIYLGGKKLHRWIIEKWTMPTPLSIFITNYITNFIVWFILYLLIVVIGKSGVAP